MLTVPELKRIFSNEQICLLLFARLYFGTATKLEAEEFISEHLIDWDILYKIARAHGLRAFIYHAVKQHGIEVRPQFVTALRKSAEATRYQNLRKASVTSKLMGDCKKKNIIAIPYKGIVFAHCYYEDISLRESADIDFLVDKKDISQIEDDFIAEKYTPKTTVSKRYLSYYKLFFKDLVYRTPGERSFSVEMHWRLMERFSGRFPEHSFFLPHLEPYSLGGLQIQKLTPTYDFLAVASNHFVKDMGIKLKYFVDMACLISNKGHELDSNLIFSTARKYGFYKRLETGLQLTENLVGISLYVGSAKEPVADNLLKASLAFPLELPRLYINEPKFISRSLQLQDNNWQRVKFIAKSFFYMFLPTYEDINRSKLPVYLFPLLVVSRPFRLLFQALKPVH